MIRQQILANLKTNITNELALVTSNVFVNRGIHSEIEESPIINIVSKSEDVTRLSESPKTYRRKFLLDVEIVSADNDFEIASNKLEEIILKIEDRVEKTEYFNTTNFDMVVERIEYEFSTEADCPIVSGVMSYSFEYEEEIGQAVLPDLSSINVSDEGARP